MFNQKEFNEFKVPDGFEEVFPESPMRYKIFTDKDKQGNIIRKQYIHVDKYGYGHCLKLRNDVDINLWTSNQFVSHKC